MSKTKVTVTPDQISTSWNTGMKSNVAKMQRGIAAVQDSPMEKAAAAQDTMLANLTQAVTSGKWAANLRKVPLAKWKEVTNAKIVTSLPAGVDAAMDKRRDFDRKLVAALDGVLPEIAAMPNATIQDSMARANKLMLYMHEHDFS